MEDLEEEVKVDTRAKTVLIFGISGFVGSNLAEFMGRDYKVIGTYHNQKVEIPGILCFKCDVLNKEEIEYLYYLFQPDITIYAAGMPSLMSCYKQEDVAEALNVSGLINVVENSGRHKSQVIFISSAYVFSGKNKKYLEIDIPDPNTVFGKNMAASEFYLQKSSMNYLIIRTCKLYGRGISPIRPSQYEIFQHQLKTGNQIMADDAVRLGFLDVYYLAMIIKIAIDKGFVNRLLQVSSTDSMTHFDFYKKYCKVFDEPAEMVGRGKWPFPITSATGEGSDDKLQYQLDIMNLETFTQVNMPSIEDSLKFSYMRFNGVELKENRRSKGEGIKYI